ncbi:MULTISPECIES: carbohydrate ABC transporter permease [unclassified Arthrobacter]|uniref:carbohydrate ABC transporter permease n=1 Tax=unclassified Arthrobacter TaxID=235627 RepID=UPI001C855DCC|nr:sugar ABC transporter permease [Arthrobacter sp. MAHUQ-56]MBX7445924.1 sugar ABC transporter permease [Arthrobacter sp. MAHUQ-56]
MTTHSSVDEGNLAPETITSLRGGDPARRRPYRFQAASWWWPIPSLVLVLAFVYVAFASGAFLSFTDWQGLGSFNMVGLDNFLRFFHDPQAIATLGRTLLVAAEFLVANNLLGLGFALGLNRTLKTRHFLRTIVFLPVVLSPLAVSYVWLFIFDQKGPVNGLLKFVGLGSWAKAWLGDPTWALWCVVIVLVWQHIGLTMAIYLAGLAGIPPEIEEAAAIDGAGIWNRLAHVTLPLLQPTIVVASTLLLVRGLSIFDQVLALTGGGPFGATETLATLVYTTTFTNGEFGYGASISLLLTILVAVFAVVQYVLLNGRKRQP